MTTPLPRLRMPLNPKTLLLRSAYIDTQPPLQDWFMGLQECDFFIELDSIDIITSQPTAPSFGHSSLIIITILPPSHLSSRLHHNSLDDAYHTFWMESFRLFHLVKKSLQHLYLHGYSNNKCVEHQFVTPLLPRLLTLKIPTNFIRNLLDSFPHLPLSSRVIKLWPSRVEIMNGKLTLDSWYLITDRIRPVFDNLQVQAL
ncbi:hypothetical protein BT69DRAFT_1291435 [Atractiella rhizophila]|nr:hypothetical protein BT69DRAFT_1291435 [Atractiella rhizophila]